MQEDLLESLWADCVASMRQGISACTLHSDFIPNFPGATGRVTHPFSHHATWLPRNGQVRSRLLWIPFAKVQSIFQGAVTATQDVVMRHFDNIRRFQNSARVHSPSFRELAEFLNADPFFRPLFWRQLLHDTHDKADHFASVAALMPVNQTEWGLFPRIPTDFNHREEPLKLWSFVRDEKLCHKSGNSLANQDACNASNHFTIAELQLREVRYLFDGYKALVGDPVSASYRNGASWHDFSLAGPDPLYFFYQFVWEQIGLGATGWHLYRGNFCRMTFLPDFCHDVRDEESWSAVKPDIHHLFAPRWSFNKDGVQQDWLALLVGFWKANVKTVHANCLDIFEALAEEFEQDDAENDDSALVAFPSANPESVHWVPGLPW
jgi:hypothetical protein